MQNKFGLKDFVFLVLLLAVGVSVWLAMVQRDREVRNIHGISSKLDALERHMMRMEERLESGVVAIGAAAPGAGQPAARDESWARPGVPVEWQEPWGFATDPRQNDDFAIGGEFTEIFNAQPAKIVPFLSQDVYGRRVTDRVCDTLAAYDPQTLQLRGVLAQAWQMDPEGLWLRALIHPRARFSDGQPVTAEDVRWTFHEFILNPEIEAERSRSLMRDSIDRVEVVSDRVVEFTFHQAMFNNKTVALGTEVLPKHFYSQFTPAQINQSTGLLMGSGPFKLAQLDAENQWTPGRDVVLVRNELYWGPKPPLERLRFKAISDELARLTAYRNNEGDMTEPSSPQFTRAQQQAGWEEENYSLNWINMRSGISFIAWQCGPRNGRPTPFHDRRVRLAMTHLLDRERMIRDIYDGIGVVATGPSNPTSPANDPDIAPVPYNVDRARELLAEAGWTDRGDGVLRNERGDAFVFEFTHASGGEVIERVARYIQSQCALVGIRCTIRPVDWSIYTDILNRRDFDAITMGWSATAPESDPMQIWHSRSIENQGDNFIQWGNPEADRLIDAGRREMNDQARFQIWRELHAVIHEDQPYTFMRAVPWLRFVKKRFENVHTYPKGLEPVEFYVPSPGAAAARPM